MKEYLRSIVHPQHLDDDHRLSMNNIAHEDFETRRHVQHNYNIRRSELSTGRDLTDHYEDAPNPHMQQYHAEQAERYRQNEEQMRTRQQKFGY